MTQVFVESLDRSFEEVCELDLVFHFDEVCAPHALFNDNHVDLVKVHHILSEIVQGGLVMETNISEICNAGARRIRICTIY